MKDDAKGLWVEELQSTLWVIRTIVHSDIRDTPFNLALGTNAVIPVKVGINTFRVRHFDPSKNEHNIRTNLDLLKKAREEANVQVVADRRAHV